MPWILWLLAQGVAAAAALVAAPTAAARDVPPAPDSYVLDEAGWLTPDQRAALGRRLEAFERESSNQIVVAIFQTLDGADLAEFNNKVANAWGIGRAGKDNGLLLAVYADERKIAIEVGYGLEGRVTDLVSDLIIRQQLGPAFADGRYAAGLDAGVEALIAACRGEYLGTGKTAADERGSKLGDLAVWLAVLLLLVVGALARRRRDFGPVVFGPGSAWEPWQTTFPTAWPAGRTRGWDAGVPRSGGGGAFRGGGGGAFRGGGGSFGGGGARGGW